MFALAFAPLARADVDVVELTVKDVEEGLAAGEFSSLELTQTFLDRINTYEPFYNAFISFNDNALVEAAALDAEYMVDGPRSPLHGVPIVIKDNMDIAGVPTTNGFEGFSSATGGIDLIPEDDADLVGRLKAAGAVILGKTNLPDFAFDGTRTESSVAGVTYNAYNRDWVPGGSSGGTATAVNGSFAVFGTGTETGTSIQNPSSYQGLVGIRPTYGLVPSEGVFPLLGTFRDVAGPITKTVYDAAVALDVMAGPTLEDLSTYASVGRMPEGGYTSELTTDALDGAKLGFFDGAFDGDFDELMPETEALYLDAVETMEGLGAEFTKNVFSAAGWAELANDNPGNNNTYDFDVYNYLQQLGSGAITLETYNSLVDPDSDFLQVTDENLVDPLDNPDGQEFLKWRAELRLMFEEILDDNELDALVWPQSAEPQPDLASGNTEETTISTINYLGIPGVMVNGGYYEDGKPFSLMFIGRAFDEAEVLGLAYAYEQATMSRIAPTLIPEPASLALLGLGALLIARRRRRS
jgi:Asp-tRNA(Asn)/Glu-tRNA(Gln) amidotransferase A subunit family amidase